MQDKKKTKNIKVRDLKPKKDAKGGQTHKPTHPGFHPGTHPGTNPNTNPNTIAGG
jgi:hypothetical protein